MKVRSEKDAANEKPMLHLPRLTEQDLQDYIRWQEQIKSSLERHAQSMNSASQKESAIVLMNNISPVQNGQLKSADMVESAEKIGESSLSKIYTDESFWSPPQKKRQDL